MEFSTLNIYLITAFLSMAIGSLLVYVSTKSYYRRSEERRKEERERRRRNHATQAGPGNQTVKNIVYDEIKEFVKSEEERKEISETVSAIFRKELKEQVDVSGTELKKKFNKIIEEKSYNEKQAFRKYKKILSAKKETDAVIRSVAEGLVVVDPEGKVVMMNPAAEKLLGGKKEKKVGKPIGDGLGKEQLVSFSRNAKDGEGKEIEVLGSQEDTKKILRASNAVIENKNGQTVGMVSVLSDITKQKELERLKSGFVANVTHELRTPLISMDKSISLLLSKQAGLLSETQEQFLSIASRNLKRLTALINDLLDISKLESGKMAVNLKPASIEKIITEVVENFKDWAKTKSVRIKKEVDREIPELNLDADRIIQVLNNLIGNAIKFTPEGGAVRVGARIEGENLKVNIKDTGIGIPKKDTANIFSKFYQSGERAPTDINGTGLGLSIVKEIIELHKGKVWVESEKGKGANFIFTLPVK